MSTLITNTLQGINTVKYDANTTAMTIDSSGSVLPIAASIFWQMQEVLRSMVKTLLVLMMDSYF